MFKEANRSEEGYQKVQRSGGWDVQWFRGPGVLISRSPELKRDSRSEVRRYISQEP
jgi:hypothetical protein